MHTEEIDQHDTEPESRNGDTYITKHTGNLIQNTILILSGIQAQYNGNEKTKQHAGSHEDHGCGEASPASVSGPDGYSSENFRNSREGSFPATESTAHREAL